jgi:hypothetical protein
VEGGQVKAPAVAASLPHTQEPEGVAVDWYIHSIYAIMVVNGLGGWRDAKVRNFSQYILA